MIKDLHQLKNTLSETVNLKNSYTPRCYEDFLNSKWY